MEKIVMKKLGCKIKLGDWLETFLEWITFGNSHYWAYIVAVEWLGYESCGCEERRIKMNKWTCKNYKENE
jgi:hypothetical protein